MTKISSAGQYMPLEDFYDGVECGAYGPDEDCRWIYIDDDGHLCERPVEHPYKKLPPRIVAVVYYAA